jgi:hypothetical protein
MDLKTYSMQESRINMLTRSVSDFSSFYDAAQQGMTNALFEETMSHADRAMEMYREIISMPHLLKGFRDIAERKRDYLEKRVAMLERKHVQKATPVSAGQ